MNEKPVLFYEKQGSGRPLLLVHGNSEDHTIFDRAVQVLAKNFTVYAIDSRGHGKTPWTGKLHYRDMAQDILDLLEEKDLKDVIYYGFSDGGIIGLIAVAQTERITDLVVSGANTHPDAVVQPLKALIRVMYTFTGDPKMELMLKEPDITAEELSRIHARTLVLAGQHDAVLPADTRFIAESIPGAVLRILASESHGSYIVHDRRIADLITAFVL